MKRPKSLLLIYYLGFLCSMSTGSYEVLIPVYAQILGASYFDIGIIGTLGGIPTTAFPIMVGSLSDKYGRKKFILAASLICTLIPLFLSKATQVIHVAIAKFIVAIIYAVLWPTMEAFLSDITDISERNSAVGRLIFSSGLGFFIGPFLGGFISENFSFSVLFFIASFLGFLAFLGTLIIHEEKRIKIAEFSFSKDLLKRLKDLVPIFIIAIVCNMSLSLILNIFPAFAYDKGLSNFYIGALFSIFEITRIITSLQLRIFIKIGEKNLLLIGTLAQATSLLFIAHLINSYIALILSMIVIGFGFGVVFPLTISLTSRKAPEGKVGSTIGILETSFGFGWLITPLVTGFIANSFNPSLSFLFISFIGFLALIMFIFHKA
ncbi:MAG: MFS transporter [Candidatus Bathyarchaeia archaeon]